MIIIFKVKLLGHKRHILEYRFLGFQA